jgi:hypothetical protein
VIANMVSAAVMSQNLSAGINLRPDLDSHRWDLIIGLLRV